MALSPARPASAYNRVMDKRDERAMLDLCERFFAAVAAGDLDAVRAMYAPDAAIWHNNDGLEQTVEQNMRILRWATSAISGFHYEDVRRRATADGFIEEHVMRGTAPNGEELRVHTCLVCTVRDGRITRVNEYFDSAQIAALLA
jgi:ketosteroid isomerase-like protein